MWSVNMNETWYPARDERQIVNWLREGRINLKTLVYRENWQLPIPLAEVPELQALVAQDERAQQLNTVVTRVVLWTIVDMVVFPSLVAIAFFSPRGTYAIGGAGIVGAALFFFGRRGPRMLEPITSTLRKHSVVTLSWCVAALLATLTGSMAYSSHYITCKQYASAVLDLRKTKWPSDADAALKKMSAAAATFEDQQRYCDSVGMPVEAEALAKGAAAMRESQPDVLKMVAEVREQQKLHEQAAASARADEEARQKEINAVRSFPELARDVSNDLALASTNAESGKWPDVDRNLDDARTIINGLIGTSVEHDARFIKLSEATARLSARYSDAIAKAHASEIQRSEQAAPPTNDNQRGEPPQQDFDGCYLECHDYLRNVLNDPSSYECVAATRPQIEGEYWTVDMRYRAKDAFGALVMTTQKFFIQGGQVVKTLP